jgi:hypothetical protein
VTETDGHRRAGFGGIATCGSVWACPVCSAKIGAHRQGEIEQALSAWHGRGGRVALATFTMRHNASQSLADLWEAKSYAWGKVTSGRAWVDDQEQFGTPLARTITRGKRKGEVVTEGRVPWIAVTEVTHGQNGWHVHVHVLLLLAEGSPDTDPLVAMMGDAMFSRWRDALQRKGFAAPRVVRYNGPHESAGYPRCDRLGAHTHGGFDWRLLHGDPAAALGEYFTKVNYSASMELARGDLKAGRGRNRTPFTILRNIVTTGDADDLDLWHEWEQGSRGRRQIGWSVGLRGLLLGTEDTPEDEEIAAADEGGTVEYGVHRSAWKIVVGLRVRCDLLEHVEQRTAEAWATGHGLRVRTARDGSGLPEFYRPETG